MPQDEVGHCCSGRRLPRSSNTSRSQPRTREFMDRSVEPAARERLTVAGLLHLVRQRPRIFLATACLTVAAVIAYAYLATPVYRASVKMMPRQNELGGGGLQGLLSQFSGLASLAGLSVGSVDQQESIALLKSRALFTL